MSALVRVASPKFFRVTTGVMVLPQVSPTGALMTVMPASFSPGCSSFTPNVPAWEMEPLL